MKLLLLFSAQEECWSPGAASGGGQLHRVWEESRAWMAGIDCQEEYREKMWMCDVLISSRKLKFGLSGFRLMLKCPVSQMKFLVISSMCNFSILCRKRVAVGWGLDEEGGFIFKTMR